MLKRLSLFITIVLVVSNSFAQTINWPSPQVEQMYRQAKESLSRGAVQQSIALLKQAIEQAPDVMILKRDLAQALILVGDYDAAYKSADELIDKEQADEITYQIAATALKTNGDNKKSKKIIEKGIKKYPQSGLLYNELGKYYEEKNDLEYALDSWLLGIEGDPAYHLNYYNAARIYANTNKPIWTLIYGEMFINLERQTNRSTEIEKLMLDAYRRIFTDPASVSVPKYGENITNGEEKTFEAAVMKTLQPLSFAVADGITTENLIMLRTRFVMDWMNSFAAQYPFTLFTYQNKLLGDGEFDAYNQFVFGKSENANQYESWKQFHPEAISGLETWASANTYKPARGEFYNKKDLRTLFRKK